MQMLGYKIPMWASLVLWALVWEIIGQANVTILLPPLSHAIMRLFEIVPTETFWVALRITGQAFFLGVAISVLVGVPLGVLMGRSPMFDRLLLPWVGLFVSAPLTALVPVIMALFGFGETTIVLTVVLFVTFVVPAVAMLRERSKASKATAPAIGTSTRVFT